MCCDLGLLGFGACVGGGLLVCVLVVWVLGGGFYGVVAYVFLVVFWFWGFVFLGWLHGFWGGVIQLLCVLGVCIWFLVGYLAAGVAGGGWGWLLEFLVGFWCSFLGFWMFPVLVCGLLGCFPGFSCFLWGWYNTTLGVWRLACALGFLRVVRLWLPGPVDLWSSCLGSRVLGSMGRPWLTCSWRFSGSGFWASRLPSWCLLCVGCYNMVLSACVVWCIWCLAIVVGLAVFWVYWCFEFLCAVVI